MATSTVENYLKAILHLDEDTTTTISVGAIAGALEVTPGTVSSMMRHLSEGELITYVPRRSVNLTEKGRFQALQVVRRHRLVETFLVEVMKLDWSEVHEEAEVLEHVVSDRLLSKMDEMLGHPSHDPHGDPIPDAKGNYAVAKASEPLAGLQSGEFRLVRVDDSDSEMLDWLRIHDLRPGSQYEIKTRDPIAGIIEIEATSDKRIVRLGEKIADRILVEPIS